MSWIEDFEKYTASLPSPPIFRRWSAVSAVAGALERKVWVRPFGPALYPNLYIVLCGPPGIGKTAVTSQVGIFWHEVPDLHIAPSSVTAAALIDSIEDAKRSIINEQGLTEFNSIQVNSNELGVLLPGYDSELMNNLTDIYDGHPYSQRRRGGNKKVMIKNPLINMLAATTPGYLTSTMPPGAWDQGFMSRLILIYSGEAIIRPLFSTTVQDKKLFDDLVLRLKAISKLHGEVRFTPEAAAKINAWHMAGGPPKPEHPRLVHYLTRRTTHLFKLCMIMSAASRNDLIVDEEVYAAALDLLIEAEFFMGDIFKAMASGGDVGAIKDVFHYVMQLYVRNSAPVKEYQIISFLQERVPAHSVVRILELMVMGKLLKPQLDEAGGKVYIPTKRD